MHPNISYKHWCRSTGKPVLPVFRVSMIGIPSFHPSASHFWPFHQHWLKDLAASCISCCNQACREVRIGWPGVNGEMEKAKNYLYHLVSLVIKSYIKIYQDTSSYIKIHQDISRYFFYAISRIAGQKAITTLAFQVETSIATGWDTVGLPKNLVVSVEFGYWCGSLFWFAGSIHLQ